MKSKWFVFSFLAAAAMAVPAWAQLYQCPSPTAAIRTVNYPGVNKIPSGNNLVMPAGKAVEAEGQKLLLIGRILDKNCMPIKDAQIEIWQADPFGKWFLATRADLVSAVPVFAGAGRTYSSNLGEFIFTTLFPAPLDKRAPFINIRVKVRDMKPFETQLFFERDGRNGTDKTYNALKGDAPRSVTMRMQPLANYNGFAGMIDIVLPEAVKYVSY